MLAGGPNSMYASDKPEGLHTRAHRQRNTPWYPGCRSNTKTRPDSLGYKLALDIRCRMARRKAIHSPRADELPLCAVLPPLLRLKRLLMQ